MIDGKAGGCENRERGRRRGRGAAPAPLQGRSQHDQQEHREEGTGGSRGQVEHRGEDEPIDSQQAKEQGFVTAAPEICGETPQCGNAEISRQDLANIGVEATGVAMLDHSRGQRKAGLEDPDRRDQSVLARLEEEMVLHRSSDPYFSSCQNESPAVTLEGSLTFGLGRLNCIMLVLNQKASPQMKTPWPS